MLQDVKLEPVDGQKVDHAVVILHGYGDSANGIIGLAEDFRPALPSTLFLAPDAPFPHPHLATGRQWFDIESWSPAFLPEDIHEAASPLTSYLDKVLTDYRLPANKLALVGFSQGTMMSLYVAPRRPEPVAGILGYSGALIGASELKPEVQSKPPVMLIHGTDDNVLPHQWMSYAEEELKNVGIETSTFTCPNLGHSIDMQGIRAGASFLQRVLSP